MRVLIKLYFICWFLEGIINHFLDYRRIKGRDGIFLHIDNSSPQVGCLTLRGVQTWFLLISFFSVACKKKPCGSYMEYLQKPFSLFLEWVHRFRRCIDKNWEYVFWTWKISRSTFFGKLFHHYLSWFSESIFILIERFVRNLILMGLLEICYCWTLMWTLRTIIGSSLIPRKEQIIWFQKLSLVQPGSLLVINSQQNERFPPQTKG